MAEGGRPLTGGVADDAPGHEDLFSRWVASRSSAPAEAGAPAAEPAVETPDEASAGAETAPTPAPSSADDVAHGPDNRDAGRAVLAAFAAPRAEAAVVDPVAPAPAVETEVAPAPAPDAEPTARAAATASDDLGHTTTNVEFPRRRGAQRVLLVLFVIGVAATVLASLRVYGGRHDAPAVGIALTCGVVTLVLWAVRASMPETRVAIRRGLLEVQRGGARWSIDVTHAHVPVELVGPPRGRRWRVRFPRLDQDALVIDAGMVDPDDFTTALLRLRPELAPVLRP